MYRTLKEIQDMRIHAAEGEIGRIADIYFDDNAWVVRYFVVEAGAWLDGRKVLIAPAALGQVSGGDQKVLHTTLSREQLRNAPDSGTEQPVSRQVEENLVGYYNWPAWWTAGMGPTMAVGAPNYPAAVPIPITGRENSGLNTEDSRESMADAPLNDQRGDPHLRSLREVVGYRINADDGEVGRVADLIVDDEKWRILYMIVDTGGLFSGKKVLVSPSWVEAVSWLDKAVDVGLKVDTIRKSPQWDPSQPLDRVFEEDLYHHYDRKGYWQ